MLFISFYVAHTFCWLLKFMREFTLFLRASVMRTHIFVCYCRETSYWFLMLNALLLTFLQLKPWVSSIYANRDTTLFIILVQAINDHVLSCDYESMTFEVLSVDSLNSFKDGIFIVVIGFLTGKDNLKRKFSQTFYLARQNTRQFNVYVVLNDIFAILMKRLPLQ